MVKGWPQKLLPFEALELGFIADDNFEDIIKSFIKDELE